MNKSKKHILRMPLQFSVSSRGERFEKAYELEDITQENRIAREARRKEVVDDRFI